MSSEGGVGGGGGWNPTRKPFYLWWKAFDLLNNKRYILGVVALLEASDVTNNCCHLGRHFGFYQELGIRSKPRELLFFCALNEK